MFNCSRVVFRFWSRGLLRRRPFAQHGLSIERIQRLRPRVLYIFLGVLQTYGVFNRRRAAHDGDAWDVRPDRDFKMLVEIARAAFVATERRDESTQVIDQAQVPAEFR